MAFPPKKAAKAPPKGKGKGKAPPMTPFSPGFKSGGKVKKGC